MKTWYVMCNLRVDRGGTSHSETPKWLTDTVNSFSHHPSASKAGFETTHMLWKSLLTVQHPIFTYVLGDTKNLAFC